MDKAKDNTYNAHNSADKPNEEQIYKVNGITFLVTPVYREGGESVASILQKLMKKDIEDPQ